MTVPVDPQRPFERDAFFDDPGIVGARWWNRSFEAQGDATRRQAVKALGCFAMMVGGVAVLGIGGIAAAVASSPDRVLRKAIDVQRRVGWSAGSFDEHLVWSTTAVGAVDTTRLARLAQTMQPRRHAPFHVATQLEALGALPAAQLEGDPYTMTDLRAELRTLRAPEMDRAYRAGGAIARIFKNRSFGVLVIADLVGAASVAFAAGAAATFEPVLVLDNWPHPAGVVPAHTTLGALATHQADFATAAAARGAAAPPLFVLAQERTNTIVDVEAQFDNRYFATLPSAEVMNKWGFSRALLVVDTASALPESGDVGVSLAEWSKAGVDVRCIGIELFRADGQYFEGDETFFHHIPWAPAQGNVPSPLPTAFSTWKPGAASSRLSPKAPPKGFGQVYVYAEEGVIVGVPAFGGTRARSSGGYGG